MGCVECALHPHIRRNICEDLIALRIVNKAQTQSKLVGGSTAYTEIGLSRPQQFEMVQIAGKHRY